MGKPTLYCDIDNVVAGFIESFCGWANHQTGKKVRWPQDIDHYYCFGLWWEDGESQDFFDKKLVEFYESCPDIAPVPWAVESLRVLEEFFNIVFITARPVEAKLRTTQWLLRHGVFHHVEFNGHDKHHIVKPGGILIEDSPHNAIAAAEHGCTVYLLDYLYNRDCRHPNIIRVSGWQELLPLLIDGCLTCSECECKECGE